MTKSGPNINTIYTHTLYIRTTHIYENNKDNNINKEYISTTILYSQYIQYTRYRHTENAIYSVWYILADVVESMDFTRYCIGITIGIH